MKKILSLFVMFSFSMLFASTATMKVAGMTCGGCQDSVTKAIGLISGIKVQSSKFEGNGSDKTLNVTLEGTLSSDKAMKLPQEISAAIKAAGFSATDIKVF
jgi:copper chaperone CopZ